MALCHANGQLFKIKAICEQIIAVSKYSLSQPRQYEGRIEVAEQILDYLNGESG